MNKNTGSKLFISLIALSIFMYANLSGMIEKHTILCVVIDILCVCYIMSMFSEIDNYFD